MDGSAKDYAQVEEEFLPQEEESAVDYPLELVPIDSSKIFSSYLGFETLSSDLERCVTNADCGENMVCLSEFCECAKQKYKRIPGPRCVPRKIIFLTFILSPPHLF